MDAQPKHGDIRFEQELTDSGYLLRVTMYVDPRKYFEALVLKAVQSANTDIDEVRRQYFFNPDGDGEP